MSSLPMSKPPIPLSFPQQMLPQLFSNTLISNPILSGVSTYLTQHFHDYILVILSLLKKKEKEKEKEREEETNKQNQYQKVLQSLITSREKVQK